MLDYFQRNFLFLQNTNFFKNCYYFNSLEHVMFSLNVGFKLCTQLCNSNPVSTKFFSFFVDPDRIVRIDNERRPELNNLDDILENGRGDDRSSLTSNSLRSFGRNSFLFRSSNKSQKSKKHPTPRRREVLLSKISIYIVYMFVCCHR